MIREESINSPDNGKINRKQWWDHFSIPSSWYLSDASYRDRERESDLDDTRSNYRRRYDDSSQGPPQAPKIQIPLALVVTIVIYLLGQLIGSIWWAATQQSDLQHEIVDRQKEEARLWQSIETYRLENNQLRVEVARNNTQIRNLKEGD
jgi:hypothetical protein